MKYKVDFKNLKKETKVFTSISSGPGGQRRDKKETAIRLHHIPSGVFVRISKLRSQEKNKKLAFKILKEKLEELNRPKKKRIPTRIPLRAKLKRLKEKKKVSERKQLRRKPQFARM